MFQTLSRNLDASRQKITKHMKSLENIDGYFMEMNEQIKNKKRAYYKCLQCGLLIYNRKNRSKVAHIILCPEASMQVRHFFYKNCRANDRPPLLAKTFYGMTPSMARRLEKERRNNGEGETGDFGDPIKIPRYGQYVIARQKLKGSTRIKDCSEEEQRMATNLLLELLVEENFPFSICDKAGCHPRALGRLLDFLRPGYTLPLGYKVGSELLDRYYLDTLIDMKSRIKWMLQDSRATLMFDGSEDVNGAPMVNILLRVMGSSRVDCTTFFLSTVYTGYDTVDADYYVRIAEKISTEFVGFECIAGVVTDNTGSVKNARETLERLHPKLFATQDQAHVADRLMADIGEIAWVKDTLQTLSMIISDVRRLRKLRARLVILMKEYNSDIDKKKAMGSNELSTEEDVDEDSEEGGNQMEGNDLPESGECQEEGDTIGANYFESSTSNVPNPSQNEAVDGCGLVEEGFLMSDVVLPSFLSDIRDEEGDIEDPEMVEKRSRRARGITG